MSIDNFLERAADSLDRIVHILSEIAANTAPVEIRGPTAQEAAAITRAVAEPAAEPTPKKRGRPAKTVSSDPGPTVAVELPTAPSNEGSGAAAAPPATDDVDDFLNDPAPAPVATPDREYTLDDVRDALIAYSKRATGGRTAARDLLRQHTGKDNLTDFTDKAAYAGFVTKVNAAN